MGVLSYIAKAISRLAVDFVNWGIFKINKYSRLLYDKFINWYLNSGVKTVESISGKLKSKGFGKLGGLIDRVGHNLPGLVKLKYVTKGGIISDLMSDALEMGAEIETADYTMVDWFNKYIDDISKNKLNGALNPDLAFGNLRWLMTELIVLESLGGGHSEFAEFFTEGLGNGISEMMEKQLIGALSIQTNIRYGSVELDCDSIGEAAETRIIDPKWLAYETMLSGAYNSTGGFTIAKGRFRTLNEMTQLIHQDLAYNIMKAYEGYQATADTFLDESKSVYNNMLYNGMGETNNALNKWINQLELTLSFVDGVIADLSVISDLDWESIKATTKGNYTKTLSRYLSKLTFIYKYNVLNSAKSWDSYSSNAQTIFNNLLQKHDTLRQEMCNILVGKEQFLYGVVKTDINNNYSNIKSFRSGGGWQNTTSPFKNDYQQ